LTTQTFNFITGTEACYNKEAKRYLFGTSEKIPPSKKEMLARIEKHIPRDRKIVFVGHDIKCDGKVLASLGSNVLNQQLPPWIRMS
jgi:hypothetical protein